MLAVTSFSFEEMVYFCLKGINSFVVKKKTHELSVHFKAVLFYSLRIEN